MRLHSRTPSETHPGECGNRLLLRRREIARASLPAQVPAEEILRQLARNAERVVPGEAQWTSGPLTELTKHIRERHHHYVRGAIPRLRALLAKVRERYGSNHPELGEIEKLFADLAREMLMHMQKEEQILFPLIDSMERAANGGSARPVLAFNNPGSLSETREGVASHAAM